jgi:hypothetical protein
LGNGGDWNVKFTVSGEVSDMSFFSSVVAGAEVESLSGLVGGLLLSVDGGHAERKWWLDGTNGTNARETTLFESHTRFATVVTAAAAPTAA